MTLLDAPAFDNARDRRRRRIIFVTLGILGFLLLGGWLFTGTPIDYPWTWPDYYLGGHRVNDFFLALEQKNDAKAYGIWVNDAAWQRHPDQYKPYTFARFEADWSPTGAGNDYGAFSSHQIRATKTYGNVLVVGVTVNGRKSKAVFLAYDRKAHSLGFSPVELYFTP